MNKQIASHIALIATLTHALGCSPIPHWNLDAGVIPFSTPLVAHHLIDGLQRLGARTDAGRLLVADAQQAYCMRTTTSETPAITTEWNIHVCDSWWQLAPERQRLVIWHELGHVLGAVHSSNPSDLMYPIPRSGTYFTEADIALICGSGITRGGVCD